MFSKIITNFFGRKATKLDRILMLTSNCYSVKFDFLRQEIVDKNYIDCIYETFSPLLNEQDRAIYKTAISMLKSKFLN